MALYSTGLRGKFALADTCRQFRCSMDILSELQWRGLIHQATDPTQLAQWLAGGQRTLYAGFDPTAESLHVGNLMPLLLLRRFQRAGHRPIALAGGATGMIGDPTGKSAERSLLTGDQLQNNLAGIEKQLQQFLDFESGGRSALLVNNADWIGKFAYTDFLRDVGKSVPVNVMLAKESIKSRLAGEAGISYTEFSYMLLQAYDFVHLCRKYECRLQVGGSDQWGNITAGIDLARRLDGAQLFGLTCPLLTTTDGAKMGKTESGAVWLSPARTSPYTFYQYWINVADDDAGTCLRFLTDLDEADVLSLDRQRQEQPERRESQHCLAEALTRLVHGPDGLRAAQTATQVLFGAEFEKLTDQDLSQIFADVPSQDFDRSLLEDKGFPLIDALVQSTLAKSKGEARRTIGQGGAYVNNRRWEDADAVLTSEDLASESMIVLRSGRKKYALLRFRG